ncbi:2OG-Fe(II) oxygenase [Acidiferrimicrobium sp. IK]|uniref:2OG-Fe(II) oxygenase n=1 Tax=Acidiferrimicrobium sp. IK TaxID=2871700 RepID=UPI0021CAF385|nr:2OG-Fe(II) oxygenase [Acidiferrimicrobium sp. IK]MCU4183391.1 2OG-Fe(II) oxygenase [Acidiferrimicrobium sp. IK]
MVDPARDRLAGLLAGITASGAFSAARTAPARDLHLEVRGIGPIGLPVTQAQARELCLISRPARYGRGEQTLVDRSIRDTWEVPKRRVIIDKRRFDDTMRPVLDRLGRELGLPSGRALRAEFHSMLVYAPGQFFVPHQDSEKTDDMVASLVVGLPSNFTGGALTVRHHGETATYRGSKKALSFVAFYGDCRHEVKPVNSGYRVVLTYNLLLDARRRSSPEAPDAELIASLVRCLEEHFGPDAAPDRLVYLLNHEYTPRGLGWSRLKGADVQQVNLLRAAAEAAGCDAVLALADVHETWSAFEPDRRSWHRQARYGWTIDDEDDLGENGGDGYELDGLIESEITLEQWVDPSGDRLSDLGLPVGDREVCASSGSDALDPYQSEYEGYMGNWGNTLDRWYHRGAVVVWPRSRAFAVRAEASPSWALDSIVTHVRKGDVSAAQESAAMLSPFWERATRAMEASGFFVKTLRVARLVDDPALATMLLGPFRTEMLTPGNAKALGALLAGYGEAWAKDLVAGWSARRRFHYSKGRSPRDWIVMLPELCVALQESGDGGTVAARLLVRDAWKWLATTIGQGLDQPARSRREESLSQMVRPVAALLEAAALVGAVEVRDEAVELLCGEDEDIARCAIGILRATPTHQWPPTGLDTVASHLAVALEGRMNRPARADGDWSVELQKGCGCELCGTLRMFLQDRCKTTLEWPLAQERRSHVHRRLDDAELPVTHQTRRQGRPYTLVLTKTEAVFEQDRQRRRRDDADLAWLKQCQTVSYTASIGGS